MGAVALDRTNEREIELLQQAGFNAIRTAHNPPAPALLDACDRLGMLVWDEFSDMWDAAKNPDDYHLYFPQYWPQDLTSLILRDRNHPSVIIWSLGNEINDTTDGARGKQMIDLVHSLDTSRPTTQDAGPFATLDDPEYQYVDVADFHYDNPARGSGVPASAASLHAAFPDKAVTKSESWALTMYDDWQLTQANDWFVGSWVWTGMDYLGESGVGAPLVAASATGLPPFGNGNYPWFVGFSGDLDLIGQRKPQNYWRAVVLGSSPVEMLVEQPTPPGTEQFANLWQYYDELESWNWDVPAGQAMKVRVYTAGDSVTLLLNGREVATNTLAPSDKLVTTFSVPYAPGTLTAVARRNGRVIARKTLVTTGAPAAIRLTSDVDALTTSRDDLAHVLVEIVDFPKNSASAAAPPQRDG
jgi:beta-galactosidase